MSSVYDQNQAIIQKKKEEIIKSNIAVQRFKDRASGARVVSIKNANVEFIPGVGYVKPKEPSPPNTVTVTKSVSVPAPKPEPKFLIHSLDPFFGPSVMYDYATAPEWLKKKATYVETYNPEERALTGLGIVTTSAIGVGVPLAGAAGLGAIGVGEGVTRTVFHRDVTIEEAVSLAGIGEIAYIQGSQIARNSIVKNAYENLMGKLSPERTMYNRVIVGPVEPTNLAETPSIETQSFTDKIMGKLAPERAMYNRNVLGKILEEEKPTTFEGPAQTQKGGYAQQLLYKQASIQKTAMKPFLETFTLPKTIIVPSVTTTLKTTTKTMKQASSTKAIQKIVQNVGAQQTSLTQTTQQQTRNPFLAFPGKPYYMQRTRETEEETLFIVYPPGRKNPIAPQISVANINKVASLAGIKARQNLASDMIQNAGLVSRQVSGLLIRQKQITQQVTIQKQIQNLTQIFKQSPQTQQRINPKIPSFPLGGGEASTRSSDVLIGKWYPRNRPVKSWDKMLGTFGFKVKSAKLKRLGKMEVPNIHRIVTGGKKRRKRR